MKHEIVPKHAYLITTCVECSAGDENAPAGDDTWAANIVAIGDGVHVSNIWDRENEREVCRAPNIGARQLTPRKSLCMQVKDTLAPHNRALMKAVHILMKRSPRATPMGAVVWRWHDVLWAADSKPGLELWEMVALSWYPQVFDDMRDKEIREDDQVAMWNQAYAFADRAGILQLTTDAAKALLAAGGTADTGKAASLGAAPWWRQLKWLFTATRTTKKDFMLNSM